MTNQAFVRLAAFLMMLMMSVSVAKSQVPFSDTPTPKWIAVLGIGNSVEFDSPDQACRAAHAYYNPNAT
jgi:hypothetical protein